MLQNGVSKIRFDILSLTISVMFLIKKRFCVSKIDKCERRVKQDC